MVMVFVAMMAVVRVVVMMDAMAVDITRLNNGDRDIFLPASPDTAKLAR
jgi:hypothetical protein